MSRELRVGLLMVLLVSQPADMAQMRAHFEQALVLHSAVIGGELATVAPAARVLADQVARFQAGSPSPASPAASRALTALADGASKVAEAKSILDAAIVTAEMLSACGRCHRASRVTPTFPGPAPSTAGGLVGHMREHQVAADQLVQGLVVPSDAAWRSGARALATAPMHAEELPLDPVDRPPLARTEERLHRLATGAAEATDPAARAAFYGQFLAGCADCHTRYAKAKPRP